MWGRRSWMVGLILLSGCSVCMSDVDQIVCSRAEREVDVERGRLPDRIGPDDKAPTIEEAANPRLDPEVVQVGGAKEPKTLPKTLMEHLQVPAGLPGGQVKDIELPPSMNKEAFEAAMKKYFPPLPVMPALPAPAQGPFDHPLTLTELQKLALTNSPVIRQAAADVEAARGAALQAGLYPNPTAGYQGDAFNQSNGVSHTPGTHGGFVEQVIKTANKLGLARAAANQDIRIAEFKLRQAESDVQTQVRSGYFALLSARKNLEVNRSLAQLTDQVYKVLVLQLQAGEVAAYEPMQVRVLALQARGQVIQAHNRFLSAWKQLAANLGLPGMPLTDVAGQVDMAIPRFHYDQALSQILTRHTDVLAAQAGVDKARLLLRLAQVQPVPDIDLRVVVQKDFTNFPNAVTSGVQVGVPLPVWDRNQGNIRQATANLQRANDENHRLRNSLTAKVADAFERYENNRHLLELYQKQMLPNQVQAFRAAVARHAKAGEKGGVSYNDLVTAEQTLANLLTGYLGVLRDQWDAVVDLAGLLQTNDLFQIEEQEPVAPIPDLCDLAPAPACSPLRDPALRRADTSWPPALPQSPR